MSNCKSCISVATFVPINDGEKFKYILQLENFWNMFFFAFYNINHILFDRLSQRRKVYCDKYLMWYLE